MTPEIKRRARRAAALALLAVLLTTAWFGVIEPIASYTTTAGVQRGIALRALKRNRQLLRQGPAIQAARASVDQSPRWQNFYDSPRADAATLQLETDLRALFRDSNSPTSMTAEAPAVQGSITRIGVRITLSMRIDQLAEGLDRIQKQSRQLRVESLVVLAPEIQGAQTNPMLTVQAQVSALMLDRRADRS